MYLARLRQFNRDVRLFLVATALNGFSRFGIQMLLLNLYLLRLGYGPEFIGLFTAVSTFAYTLFCLPAGALGTRWGSRRMLITGAGMMMAGSLLLPLAEMTPPAWRAAWLMATSVLARLGLALYHVNGAPFLMGITGSEERVHAFSVEAGLGLLTGFAGSLVGGLLPGLFAAATSLPLEDPAPYRYPLLISGLLVIPAVLALLSTHESHAERASERVARSTRPPYGLLALVAAVIFLRTAGEGPLRTFFNVYLDDALHTPTALIGSVTAAIQLLSGLAALAAPLVVARWDNRRIIILGALGTALSLLPVALIPHWKAAGLGTLGLSVLSWISLIPLRIYTQEIVSSGWQPAMSGVLNMADGLSVAAMSLGGGYIISAVGYPALFLLGAALTASSALVFWAYFRVPRGELASPPAADVAG